MLARIYIILLLSNSISTAQSIDFFTEKKSKVCLIDSPRIKQKYTEDVVFNNLKNATNVHVKPYRLAVSIAGLVITNWSLYQPFKDVWWQDNRTAFHFYRGYRRHNGYWDFGWYDSLYGHMDKLGHFYSSKLMADLLIDLSQWVGFSSHSSRFIGPVASFLLISEIEIYDAFFQEWGFSLADLTANAFGSFSPLLKQKIPFFNRFKLKLSYQPSGYYKSEKYYIKDYAGMTFWLSYDLNQDLPKNLAQYWPDFLNIAIGYGVDKPDRGHVEIFLAPDIKISKVKQGWLSRFFRLLDYVHFPSITWQLSPRNKFYYLYF